MPPIVTKQTTTSPTPTSKSSVLNRIAPIGFKDDEGIKLLLYGRSGTGKTTLWATFPKPILAIICSGGNNPGELRSVDTAENRKTISQVVLHRSSELKEITDHLKRQPPNTAGSYATIVLDHLSGMADLNLAEIIGHETPIVSKTWGLASREQYGQSTVQCKDLLRGLLDLTCNVVIVAQEREFNNEAGNSEVLQVSVGAAVTPSLAGWVNCACDYVCQTFLRQRREKVVTHVNRPGQKPQEVVTWQTVKGVEYCLRTAADPVYATKFRVPNNPLGTEPIVNATYDKIMKLIRGDKS